MINVYFCYVPYKNPKFALNQKRSMQILQHLTKENKIKVKSLSLEDEIYDLTEFEIHNYPVLKRNSRKEIKNTRNLPYIKEILNYACEDCEDYFGYINSDILIGLQKFFDNFEELKMAYCFSRFEIGEIPYKDFLLGKYKTIYGGDSHSGMDGVFFKKDWWKKNSDLFPDDLILGETEWDTVYRTIIRSKASYLESKCLGHVYHDPQWNIKTPGAVNNIKIWKEIKKEYLS